jgi:hypothetical protein
VDAALAATNLNALAGTTGRAVNVGSQVIELQSPYQSLAELGSSLRLQSDRTKPRELLPPGAPRGELRREEPAPGPGAAASLSIPALQVELDHLLHDVALDSVFDRPLLGVQLPPS